MMLELAPRETVVVLDTSVIVKWFRQREVLADQALALRDAYLSGEVAIAVPVLVAYELANVMRYKPGLRTEQVQEAVGSLFDMGWEWSIPSSELMGRAIGIARLCGTTVYDATFAALAESLDALLITADEQLVERLETLSLARFLGEWS
jgi:predicted nucleic acid-binding protein